ncbi:MAG TPA: TlpA disulfide reductase family protein [Thermoanaerobaculia bacterium]|nr:TlpA disulfide reductase family protein [Thermoanaerobaculia bacterium]
MRRGGLIGLLLVLGVSAARAEVAEARTLDAVMRAFHPGSRIRIVSVWATWCVPCVAEIGDLQRIADRFKTDGVELIGISLDDAIPGDRAHSKQQLERFLAERHIRFRNLYYTGRTADLAERLKFDGAIPIAIVFDEAGREIARSEGKLDVDWFTKTLETLSRKHTGAVRKSSGTD